MLSLKNVVYFSLKRGALLLFLLLVVLSLVPRLFSINYPGELVFDELYFGSFVRSYFSGEHYFDIHPPFGKLVIAGIAKIGGADLAKEFESIGQAYSAKELFMLRFFPLATGAGLALLVFIFLLRLAKSKISAFLGGAMIALDNGFLAHSRAILLDIPMLFFGLLALYLFLLHKSARTKKAKVLLLLSASIAMGATVSIKWAGFGMLGILFVLAFFWLLQEKRIFLFFQRIAILAMGVLLVYVLSFALHFALLKNPGPGNAFFAPGFQEKSLLSKLWETNVQMYTVNKNISTKHPYASLWNEWPLGKQPVFFWQGRVAAEERQETLTEFQWLRAQVIGNPRLAPPATLGINNTRAKLGGLEERQEVWLAGNPVVWGLGIIGLFAGVILFLRKKSAGYSRGIIGLFLLGWLINYLPFSLISRPLFLYHYFFSLLFSLLLFSYVFPYLAGIVSLRLRISLFATKIAMISVLLFGIAGGFFFVAPITYGLPFSTESTLAQFLGLLLK